MRFSAGDRIKVSCTTTGLGTFGLGSAINNSFQGFQQANIPDGVAIRYSAFTNTDFETGQGTYSVGQTLTRDIIYASSNGGNKVNFTTSPTIINCQLARFQIGLQVDVKQFGAEGDGITDDSNAIQAALTSGATDVYLPDGDYLVSPDIIVITSRVNFGGPGRLVCVSGIPGHSIVDIRAGAANSIIGPLTFDVNFGTLISNNTTQITIRDIQTLGGGGNFCIFLDGASNSTVENCNFGNFKQGAIFLNNTSNSRVVDNFCVGGVGQTVGGHVIQSVQGTNNLIARNYVFSGTFGAFGISDQSCNRDVIAFNICEDTPVEAIEVGSGASSPSLNCTVIGNTVFWPTPGTSLDYGMSFSPNGSGQNLVELSVIGNTVIGSGKSGMGFTGDGGGGTLVGIHIIGNSIINPNQLTEGLASSGNGIDLSFISSANVNGNIIRSDDAKMNYGIWEGSGADASIILGNIIKGANTSEVLLTSAFSYAEGYYRDFTVGISPLTGAFGSATATGRFVRTGKTITDVITIIITTNGTAGGSVNVSTSHTPLGKVSATCEDVTAPAMLYPHFDIGSGNFFIYTPALGYPGVSGHTYVLKANYEIA